MILENIIPGKSSETASRLIDNEAVIIVIKDNKVNVLNEVGSRIWDIIDGENNIDEIANRIKDEFDVTYEEALKDVKEFIDELFKKNMVVLSDKKILKNISNVIHTVP